MKKNECKYFCTVLVILLAMPLMGYYLPPVNLGLGNILDGGPLRPSPGFYWQEYMQIYSTSTFLDAQGNLLGNVCSPNFNVWGLVTQFFYQSPRYLIFKAKPGIAASLPIVLSSCIDNNPLGIRSSGAGLCNLALGVYLQWDMIKRRERPIFIHRLELDLFCPIGKNRSPFFSINPSTSHFYVDPYWAATLYMLPKFAVSWRLHYLWSTQSPKTFINGGQAVHLNYSVEFELNKDMWLAISGYYLQQTKDSTLCGVPIPDSRERVFAIGPSAMYVLPHKFRFFAYLYMERAVLNRGQGINFIIRLFKNF